ncbi:MAG: hypothetical protein DRR06_04310 [Gammaproteobacteria bacterium]|nr:MAG: hypothetical protein DRR06_04310 [Gammaproteobacteria bacterium]RLA53259.1 MAG: hypothetical protein DRR42_05280 [Gammaproteobacteria bacterium]
MNTYPAFRLSVTFVDNACIDNTCAARKNKPNISQLSINGGAKQIDLDLVQLRPGFIRGYISNAS